MPDNKKYLLIMLFNFNEFERHADEFFVTVAKCFHIFVDRFVVPSNFNVAFFSHFLQLENHLNHLFARSCVYIFEVELKHSLHVRSFGVFFYPFEYGLVKIQRVFGHRYFRNLEYVLLGI